MTPRCVYRACHSAMGTDYGTQQVWPFPGSIRRCGNVFGELVSVPMCRCAQDVFSVPCGSSQVNTVRTEQGISRCATRHFRNTLGRNHFDVLGTYLGQAKIRPLS
ncbi:hypothetical protein Wildcat_172 [Mycobacterium phage Wildcat]|uniref:Uncharacterized protein n=1 Tax=Mycobacterium phage Wildcat TaxID=373415 RepID=Q19XR2_9CAUD|nr:hypothetical protein Wildcat_172 [Mycobacterium phage Wildcat]ABE67752.1 hypothetical protein Wildcat_172 [Mycobacterium phage Wildcat]